MQKKWVNQQLPLFGEQEPPLGFFAPLMHNIQPEKPGPTLTNEGVQLDLFDEKWANKLRDKYGIANPFD